jgi:hypothetical protein
MNAFNMDANTTVYLSRELERIKSMTYDVKYGALRAAEIFQFDTELQPYDETITYEQYDATGIADLVTNYSTDLRTVDVSMKKFTSQVFAIGLAYTFNIMDVKRNAIAGTPLQTRKALQTRRGIAEKHDRLFWLGDSVAGIVGLLSNANIPNAVVATGTGGTTWLTKTAEEIVADLSSAVLGIKTLTKGIEKPNLLLLSESRLELIRTKRSTLAGGLLGRTVLEIFKTDYPEIRVEGVEFLAGQFQGGAEGFILGTNDPMAIQLKAPIVYEELPVQTNNLAFKVPAIGTNGGVAVYYPLAFTKKYGI